LNSKCHRLPTSMASLIWYKPINCCMPHMSICNPSIIFHTFNLAVSIDELFLAKYRRDTSQSSVFDPSFLVNVFTHEVNLKFCQAMSGILMH
jgi:hypothetical protein